MIELFREIDQRWGVPFTPKPILHLIGAGALIIQEPRHQRATKDGDIYEALPLEQPVQDRLLELAGRNSEIHVRLRLYVEILHNGFPFLPQLPVWHPIRSFAHFDLVALDIVDICVSKLIRFSADDREDIDAMVQCNWDSWPMRRFSRAFVRQQRSSAWTHGPPNFRTSSPTSTRSRPT